MLQHTIPHTHAGELRIRDCLASHAVHAQRRATREGDVIKSGVSETCGRLAGLQMPIEVQRAVSFTVHGSPVIPHVAHNGCVTHQRTQHHASGAQTEIRLHKSCTHASTQYNLFPDGWFTL